MNILTDWDFWIAFGRTVLLLTVALNLEMLLGLGLALLVEKATRGQRVLRTLMMFPMMFSPILVGFQFKFMFNDNIGLVNNALQALGLTDSAIPWLIDGDLAFIAILVAEIWSSTSVFAILILAGLLAMPQEPIEAARVDGCTPWQTFRYVTWPFVMPFAFIAMTIRSLDVARAYDIVKIMTDGGPARPHRADLDAGGAHRLQRRQAWAWPTPWPISRSCCRSSSPSISSASSPRRARRSARSGEDGRELRPPHSSAAPGTSPMLVGLFLAMLIICMPGIWIVLSSLRPTVEIMAKPPVWIPQELSLDAYVAMFSGVGKGGIPVVDYFRNSLIISITSTVIAIVIGMAGGYAFARYRFRGKSAMFLGLMLTRTVPGIALSLPLFFVYARLGIIDTHFGLILAYVALNVPFTIWLIDGFFRQVPKDLAEAAQIDGCTRWQAFWQVEFPLAGPGIASAGIFAFLTSWNEFALASQLTRSINSKTLPVGLLDYTAEFTIDWRGMCALAVVMIIPALTLTFIVQKHLVSGLTSGAVKG